MFRLAAGTAVVIALASMVLASEVTNPVPPTAKSVETGRKLFQEYCSPCHGKDAKGDGLMAPKDIHPPNLTDAVWAYGATDEAIFTNIRNGIGPKFNMKSWKSKMTDEQIWSVVNYLRSLAAK